MEDYCTEYTLDVEKYQIRTDKTIECMASLSLAESLSLFITFVVFVILGRQLAHGGVQIPIGMQQVGV